MKVFVLSLHRCGTKSTISLLQDLGLNATHTPHRRRADGSHGIEGRELDYGHVMDVIAPVLDEYDAAADVPIPTLYHELQERFPDAKFLLGERDPLSWVKSALRSVEDHEFRALERVQYWRYFPSRPRHISELSRAELIGMYRKHSADIQEYFRPRGPGKLYVFDIDDPEVGTKIAEFLGIGGEWRFPNVYEKPRWRRELRRLRRRLLRRKPQPAG